MRKFLINVNGNSYEVEVDEITDGSAPVSRPAAPQQAAPAPQVAPVQTPAPVAAVPTPAATPAPAAEVTVSAGQEVVDSPMPGNIWKILVAEGDIVKSGQTLLILEAMKMENELVSPKDGKVLKIMTAEGTSVNTGDKLVIIE